MWTILDLDRNMVEEVETKLPRQDIRQDQSQHDFAADNFCPSDPNSFGRGPGYGIFGPQNSSQTMDAAYNHSRHLFHQ